MIRILIDATYNRNEKDLNRSLSLYLMRFLNNVTLKILDEYNIELNLLVRPNLLGFYKEKYSEVIKDFIIFNAKKVSRLSFIQSIVDAITWQREVKQIECDIVYVPYTWIYSALKINKKKVTTVHDLKPIREIVSDYAKKLTFFRRPILSIYRYFYKKAVKNADKIIAITHFVKNDIVKSFNTNADKIKVIYDCVNYKGQKETVVSSIFGKKYILCVNTIDEFKNTVTLIKAFTKLSTKDYYLVLVGKETDYWIHTCVPLLNDRIIRLNYVTDEELCWLYKNAILFVTPSLREGLGITPVEAAVRNCPVISSKSESLPEATLNSVFYYEPAESSDSLKNVIEDVLRQRIENENFLEQINAVGDKFRERYDTQKFPKNIITTLCECVEKE